MLRPSRDWRESITLSSRDPHFGQRIVSEHSVSHNNLWRQCTNNNRTTPLPAREDFAPTKTARLSGGHRPPLQKISAGYRLDFLCSVASISNKDTTQILCPVRGVLRLEQLWARQFFSLVSPFFLRTRNQLF